MRMIKNYGGQTISANEDRRQAEEVQDPIPIPLAQVSPAQEWSRSTELASPLVVVDLRGKEKVMETPTNKLKKRRLVQA